MLLEDIINHLADMPGQDLPVYAFEFPTDVINCVVLFPAGGGVAGNLGVQPGAYQGSDGSVEHFDYPGFQVQVRYTDPHNAFRLCENIRVWLDENLPAGYIRTDTNRSQPDDLTTTKDIDLKGGPSYRFSCDFSTIKVR
jgi:hypothetical protein